MAAGVGKTYRMLQEAHGEADAGRDVVIGYLETHGRAETAEQAAGLELLPRRRVLHRGVALEEMDMPAILRRRPELCLVDELAHTNAPGGEHAKRFEDAEELLAAGIDVYSTVNVQHLESLNDRITDLTGTRVRETLPDRMLNDAEEVVLVDLTPEALTERLLAGKVYPGDRIAAALTNFFTLDHLTALREVALLQVAEEVENRRLTLETGTALELDAERLESDAQQAIGERLLALVEPKPKAHRVVRRAWRSSQRLQAELDILWVRSRAARPEELEQLDALRRLATALGAHLLVKEGADVVATIREIAAARGTTYILMGTPRPQTALGRLLRPALPFRLLHALPGVDLRIVADRSRREAAQRP